MVLCFSLSESLQVLPVVLLGVRMGSQKDPAVLLPGRLDDLSRVDPSLTGTVQTPHPSLSGPGECHQLGGNQTLSRTLRLSISGC